MPGDYQPRRGLSTYRVPGYSARMQDDNGNKLLRALEEWNVQQVWLARTMRVSRSQVTRWTLGSRPLPDITLDRALRHIPLIAELRSHRDNGFDKGLREIADRP